MQLHTSTPFWLMNSGLHRSYPALREDDRADVVVAGAGITGALTAHSLARAGLDVLVLDGRHPGMGSTAASTALLQYEIDQPLHRLIQLVGRRRAEDAYQACYQAINSLERLLRQEGLDADFARVPSLQYASTATDVPGLEQELRARLALGFDVELLSPAELRRRFGLSAPAALYTSQAAQVNPYTLAHGLLSLPLDNLRVRDRSRLRAVSVGRRGVSLSLEDGAKVSARYLVIACGYESQSWLPRPVAEVGATYAFISKPLPAKLLWPGSALIWETKDPYLYLRATADGRLLAGGRDDPDRSRMQTALPEKVQGLLEDVRTLFPDLPLVPDFTWAGAFGSTVDSLGYAGSLPGQPRVLFNLGFGGNGILYSQIGAEVIRDSILRRKHPYARTFEFDRSTA